MSLAKLVSGLKNKKFAVASMDTRDIKRTDGELLQQFRYLLVRHLGKRGECPRCGMTVFWVTSRDEIKTPITYDGMIHDFGPGGCEQETDS